MYLGDFRMSVGVYNGVVQCWVEWWWGALDNITSRGLWYLRKRQEGGSWCTDRGIGHNNITHFYDHTFSILLSHFICKCNPLKRLIFGNAFVVSYY